MGAQATAASLDAFDFDEEAPLPKPIVRPPHILDGSSVPHRLEDVLSRTVTDEDDGLESAQGENPKELQCECDDVHVDLPIYALIAL